MQNNPFKLIFAEKYNENTIIEFPQYFTYPNKWLRILGIKYLYKSIVVNEPTQRGAYYEYTVRLIQKEIWWLFIKLRTIKYINEK